jgi:hypothetical protein
MMPDENLMMLDRSSLMPNESATDVAYLLVLKGK